MKISIIASMLLVSFVLIGCGLLHKTKQVENTSLATNKKENIDYSFMDSVRSVLMSLHVTQELDEFEPLRDSLGNVLRDKQGKAETYLKRKGKSELNQQEKKESQVHQGKLKSDKEEKNQETVKTVQKEIHQDTSWKANLPVFVWIILCGILLIGVLVYLGKENILKFKTIKNDTGKSKI